MNNKKEKKQITVFHVQFKANISEWDYFLSPDQMKYRDYYFGSISAIYETIDSDIIGIKATSLYNYNLDEETNPIYENDKCRIRKSTLITKPKKSKEEKL